jgi:hypothetical protein
MKTLCYVLILTFLFQSCTNPSDSIENTKECLTKNTGNWRHSDGNSFWEFLPDGTFKFRTTYFHGMSARGTYSITTPGEVYINYLRYPSDVNVQNQTIRLKSCTELLVGESNIYTAINGEYF